MNHLTKLAALAFLTLGLAACKKDPPPAPPPAASPAAEAAPAPTDPAKPAEAAAESTVAVSAANLGTAIGTDKKITAPAEAFAKTDTVYLSVETTGTGKGVINVKWTFKDKDGTPTTVTEGSQTIEATGPAIVDFNVSKPDGWPVGDYQAEISVNGTVAQTKLFTVR